VVVKFVLRTEHIIDRVRKKTAAWKAKTFSFVGRVILLKSVLQSLPTFVLSMGWFPKTILQNWNKNFTDSCGKLKFMVDLVGSMI